MQILLEWAMIVMLLQTLLVMETTIILKTGNSTTGTMQITDGANGNITLAPNGTGFVGVPNILFSTTATDTNSNNWEIKLSGGNLFFAYNNVNKMKLDTSGNLYRCR